MYCLAGLFCLYMIHIYLGVLCFVSFFLLDIGVYGFFLQRFSVETESSLTVHFFVVFKQAV